MTRVNDIAVSAVVLTRPDGAVLTVRKAGTTRFMLPGGKPEPGETPPQTAVRECREELGIELAEDDLLGFGSFRAAAANEPGHDVVATVFAHPLTAAVAHAAEIAELRWLDPRASEHPNDLAPLVVNHVLPALASRRSAE